MDSSIIATRDDRPRNFLDFQKTPRNLQEHKNIFLLKMMRNMYTLLTIIISMMMITIHAEDCTKNVNWKTPSERNQLAQIQNVTLAMCRGEFSNFDFALQAYKANPQDDEPLLKMICAKNSPGERRNLRALTNVWTVFRSPIQST